MNLIQHWPKAKSHRRVVGLMIGPWAYFNAIRSYPGREGMSASDSVSLTDENLTHARRFSELTEADSGSAMNVLRCARSCCHP